MRTDRELMEMAAKAYADPNINQDSENFIRLIGRDENFGCDVMVQWNPLTNDGDALRLAVKLRLRLNREISFGEDIVEAFGLEDDNLSCHCSTESIKGDPYAATRRAIVRAAAEIGRQMQEGGAA